MTLHDIFSYGATFHAQSDDSSTPLLSSLSHFPLLAFPRNHVP